MTVFDRGVDPIQTGFDFVMDPDPTIYLEDIDPTCPFGMDKIPKL